VEADKRFVSQLHGRLKRDGVECFFDERSLAPGDNFVLKISEAIDQCNYIVMVMSQAYFNARFAPTEWTAVLSDDPQNKSGRLVPLLLEECKLPSLVKALVHVDVSSKKHFEQNYYIISQKLCQFPPNDIEQRSKELDDLFEQGKLEQGMKRLLDFAHEFTQIRELLNNTIAIVATFRSIAYEIDVSCELSTA
jgi:hypothetical protein